MSEQNYPKPIQLLTGEEVAQILRISRAYAYRLMRRGNIPTIRLGRRVRVSYDSLVKFIQENNKHGHEE
jgi:excisionase family DNA binding protein